MGEEPPQPDFGDQAMLLADAEIVNFMTLLGGLSQNRMQQCMFRK